MALFGKDTKAKKTQANASNAQGSSPVGSTPRDWHAGRVIQKPRITEKAATLSAQNVYVFNVHQDANKALIKRAIRELYNVTPKKVNIVTEKKTRVMRRGRHAGMAKANKKAYVFLAAGDSINVV